LERSKALDKAEAKEGEGDRFEQEDIEFHRRLRDGFLELADAEPGRFRKIAVQQDMEETHKLVVEIVERFLKER